MAVIGVELPQDTLVLTRGRDFKWSFTNLNDAGKPATFPSGMLFFELATGSGSFTVWPFTIAGSTATIKVESEDVDLIADKTRWQLVFRHATEPAGGDAVARGVVKVQG